MPTPVTYRNMAADLFFATTKCFSDTAAISFSTAERSIQTANVKIGIQAIRNRGAFLRSLMFENTLIIKPSYRVVRKIRNLHACINQ